MSLVQEAAMWGLDEGKTADEDENSVRKKESEKKGELEILRLGTEVSRRETSQELQMTTRAAAMRRSI
jgi:hypothetical protein